MKNELKLIILLTGVLLILSSPGLGEEQITIPEFNGEYLIPGRIEGTGTYFEINNSYYLNISLTSNEEIKVVLESIPKMISLHIKNSSSIFSTILDIKGLESNKTYYKYEDSYKNEAVFISDENGSFSWGQDLSQPHHVWIQEIKGTTYINEDTVLDYDIIGSVEITADNIILDCNSHKIIGEGTGFGIYLNNKSGFILKNCIINNFSFGVYFYYSFNNLIGNSQISNNWLGVLLYRGSLNKISDNDISTNNLDGVHVGGFSNTIENNNISNNGRLGVSLWGDVVQNNIVANNNISLNQEDGVHLEYASNNTIIQNNVSLNSQHGIRLWCSGSNTISLNNFINNKTNYEYGTWVGCGVPPPNIWNSPERITYGYQGNIYTNYLGNYWSNYVGEDKDNDGIGDISHSGLDNYPLIQTFENYEIKETPPQPEKWSFAVITDLHIGRGYSDYDGVGYGDGGGGEDYYLTERLKKVVNWISENKNQIDCNGTKCPIKFLAVLGDITNNAEKSEFLKTKSILDKLNDPNGDGNTSDGIPYIPVFGNHDVWPYTDDGEASTTLGENYFDEVFWDENALNTKLLKKRLNFQRDTANPKYKNFAFNYGKMNFIGLDFDSRAHVPSPGLETGVWANAVLWDETKNWLTNRLNEFQGSTILFSHHPLFGDLVMGFSFGPSPLPNDLEEIREIIQNKNVLANFAGHIHGFYDSSVWYNWKDANEENYDQIGITLVNSTESLMMGSNQTDEYLKEHDKGVIKIVKILDENEIDYKTNEGKYKPDTGEEKEFIALNPIISFAFTKSTEIFPCVFFKAHLFTQRDASVIWDFGDGDTGTLSVDVHCYKKPGVYNVKLSAIDNKVFTEESISQEVIVEEGIIPKFIKIGDEVVDKVEVISTTLEESLIKFGRNIKDTVLIKVKHSEAKPVGLINVHFEQAAQDVDLTSLITDIDIQRKKSILYMPRWPSVVENNKILFIPK